MTMHLRRSLLILPLLVAALLLPVEPARAHATLVRSVPESNAQLDSPPAIVELYFSEPVDSSFTFAEVLDATGQRVDNDDALVDAANPTRLTVTVRSLPDGIYTVSWKALSLVDSHVTAGAFPFAVGEVDAAALAAAAVRQTANLSPGEVIFRWVSYLASGALGGGALFVLLVWRPALHTVRQKDTAIAEIVPPWRAFAAAALLALTLANLIGLLAQTGQVSGQPIAMPWNPATFTLLFTTRYGLLWLTRFALSLVAFWLLARAQQPREFWLAFAVYLLMLLTFAFNSHAAAEPRPFFPIGADWLHLTGALTWMGGLVYFLGTLWALRAASPGSRTRLIAALIPRFSALALVCVGLLGLTGVYSAYLRVATLEGLTDSLYGRMLVVKTLLALPMFLLGAINLLQTGPTMRQAAQNPAPDATGAQRFRQLLSVEAAFGVAVLLATGVFTIIPPVRTVATDASFRQSVQADDLSITLHVAPGAVGLNTFTVSLQAGGAPVTGAKEVRLQFTPATVELPPTQVQLAEAGDGAYTGEGAFLSMPDAWQVQVVVRREGQFDAFANFNVPVGASRSSGFPWARANAVLLLLSAPAYILVVHRLETDRQRARYTLYAPAAALAAAAIWVFIQPAAEQTLPVNPIPPNRESIAAGQALYRVHCLPCHGPTGRGDGPLGLTLNPPPADLYQHTQPGVHPDGRLYDWITNGFPGDSQMPAFADLLSDEERWHVVNYIRTFARQGNEDGAILP